MAQGACVGAVGGVLLGRVGLLHLALLALLVPALDVRVVGAIFLLRVLA